MELRELEVGEFHTRPPGDPDAIGGCGRWIGRDGPQLTCAAARQGNDRRGQQHPLAVLRVDNDAGCGSGRGCCDVDRDGVLEDGCIRSVPDLGDQRAHDLRAGRVAASVQDAASRMGRFLPQRQDLSAQVELRALLEQPTYGRCSTFGHGASGVFVGQAGSGGDGVFKMQVGGVVRPDRGCDAALGISGVRFAERSFGNDDHP